MSDESRAEFDATEGTPIDREKMLSIGVISKRTRPIVREGREHNDSGLPYKAVTDEGGNTVTEHSGGRAPGVSIRQDVEVRPTMVQGFGASGLTGSEE
jgi:hypothetical protein